MTGNPTYHLRGRVFTDGNESYRQIVQVGEVLSNQSRFLPINVASQTVTAACVATSTF